MPRVALTSLLVLVACDGPVQPMSDAGASPIAAAPILTPCPEGWREVPDANGLVTCDPWPTTGYDEHCAADAAHWPGSPGCMPIGAPCAADGWPSDLPTDRAIVYVDDDAPAGGDGTTRATALRFIADAAVLAPSGAAIAVATGHYDEVIELVDGESLWGACVGGTLVTSTHEDPHGAALLLHTGASIHDLTIDGTPGASIVVLDATDTSVENVVVSNGTADAVYLRGGALTASHLVIRGTRAATDGSGGRGMDLEPGSTATLDHVLIDGNREAALFATGALTSLSATDVVVRGTLSDQAHGLGGRGLTVQRGAHATLERVVIEGNRDEGIFAGDADTMLSATDVVVRGTLGQDANHFFGRGIDIEAGAQGTLARVLLEDNRDESLGVAGAGTMVAATDVVVRGTQPEDAEGAFGVGLWAQRQASVQITRGRFERSAMAGVVSVTGASVALVDVSVATVIASACLTGVCDGPSGGFGVAASFGGSLTATHFTVEDASLCGLMVGADDPIGPTSLDLSSGVVASSPVGACVQVDGYDSSRLHHDVDFRDVGVPLQATSYALPMSSDAM